MALLVATGCGGDEGDDALSKSDFVAQANEICAQGNKEIEGAFKSVSSAQEAKAAIADTVVPSIQRQIDQIRELGIPEGDEDEVNGILDDAQEILDGIEADPQQELLAAQEKAEDPFAPIQGPLADYGLTECAQ